MSRAIQVFAVALLLCCASASIKRPIRKHRSTSVWGAARHQKRPHGFPEIENGTQAQPVENASAAEGAVLNATALEGKQHVSVADDATDAVHSHHKHHQANHGAHTSELLMAYGVALIVMILCVGAMFYPLGARVVFQVVLYVGCLAFVKIALKIVYERDFHFPKFITAVHLLMSSFAAFVVLIHRQFTTGQRIATPTKNELLFGILPIASTFGLSIASENSALVFVSAAFSEVVASTNPVMSFILTWVLGMGANVMLLAPIAVVVMGCAISVEGEIYFSMVGLALLLVSVFFRGVKAVMQQKLMTGASKEKFDPVTLMAWTCMFAFVVVLLYSMATEGREPFEAIASSTDVVGLMASLLGSAVIACTLNISALFVIRQLGAVGMQMVSQMKSLLVVIGGMALLGEIFTNTQKAGFGVVLAGVYWYSRVQAIPSAKGK